MREREVSREMVVMLFIGIRVENRDFWFGWFKFEMPCPSGQISLETLAGAG